MKYDHCPKCDSDALRDRWQNGRKLRQYCSECGWKGESRTPEQQPIETVKEICANQFSGFCYTIYDKYGHTSSISRSYDNEKEAYREMEEELIRGEKVNSNEGPRTGVLWPATVTVVGTVFKIKNGKAKKYEQDYCKRT
jgi:hypothetical protein